MKKCPKCGTILDDSKKKCYMCGADLTAKTSVSDFSSNFDNNVGSNTTSFSDNVFNNGKDIKVNSEEMVSDDSNNNGSFFSHDSSSKDFFGGEINKLNSMSYDERSDTKKRIDSFFGKSKLKSKDELNKKKNKKESKKAKKITYSTSPKVPKDMEDSIIEKQLNDIKKIEDNSTVKEEVEEKKTIKSMLLSKKDKKQDEVPDAFKEFNSFNDTEKKSSFTDMFKKDEDDGGRKYNTDVELEKEEKKRTKFFDGDSEENQTDTSNVKVKKNSYKPSFGSVLKNKLDLRRKDPSQIRDLIRSFFNLACVIAFIGVLVFVYFKFIKVNSTQKVGGLSYTVSDYFKISTSDNSSKYYVSNELGNACSIKVSTGTTQNTDNYVDSYFEYIKSLYANDNEAVLSFQEMRLNGNLWRNEKVVYLPTSEAEAESTDIMPRYSYTLMTYNSSFYEVVYVNQNENKECKDELTTFMNTLKFDEGK